MQSAGERLRCSDLKMGGNKEGAVAQRPGLVPKHDFKYFLHFISVPSWKTLNPMESAFKCNQGDSLFMRNS